MVETLTTYRKQSSLYGFLCTLVVAGTIFAILFLILIHTPNPPYPEEGGGGTGNGIEVNLGFSDVGMGNQPSEDLTVKDAVAPKEEAKDQEDEKILTQDQEDAAAIKESIKKDKKVVKKEKTVKPKTDIKQEHTTPKPVVNKNALYKPNKQTSADGTSNTPGDQGSIDGNMAAKAFGKGGKGGSGGGSGGGTGTGIGTGTGPGISFSLKGRTPLSLPRPEYRYQVDGDVVVEVTVDKEGNVTQAIPGVKGSTTLNEDLLNAAKQAALKAHFDNKGDAAAYQKGTITYKFRLQ